MFALLHRVLFGEPNCIVPPYAHFVCFLCHFVFGNMCIMLFQDVCIVLHFIVDNYESFVAWSLFMHPALDTIPPSSLLEHVTSWVTSDCTLCCESVRQLAIHGTCSSPIPGLLAWCVLGPSVCSQIPDHAKEEELCSANRRRKIRASRSQLSSTLSRLHLGVLQSLDFSHTASMSQCIMSVSDVICLLNQLALLGKQVCEVGSDEDVFNLGTDRLAHGFQMAHAAGCLLVQKGQCHRCYECSTVSISLSMLLSYR